VAKLHAGVRRRPEFRAGTTEWSRMAVTAGQAPTSRLFKSLRGEQVADRVLQPWQRADGLVGLPLDSARSW